MTTHPEPIVMGVEFGPHDDTVSRSWLDAGGTAAMCSVLSAVAPELAHVVLATCHRIEIVLDGPDLDAERARALWSTCWSSLVTSVAPVDVPGTHVVDGSETVRYLFELACGLRSPLLGDTEVLGQLRRAWRDAADAGHTSEAIDRIFRLALDVGARARLDTEISVGGAGVASAVLDLIRSDDVRSNSDEQPIIVVGAGSAGRSVARRLAKHRLGRLVIANRSIDTATELADEVGGTAAPLDDLHRLIPTASVVISAIPTPVICASHVAELLDADPQWSPLLIDIASPSSIPQIDGVRLVRLDDLQTRRDAIVRRREASVPAVISLIGRQLALYGRADDRPHPSTFAGALSCAS